MRANNQLAPFHPKAILIEFWDNFPICYLYVMALGLLHFVMANVPHHMFEHNGVNRTGVAMTTLIPMSVVTFYYYLRARDSQRIKSLPRAMAAVLLLTVGLPLLIYFIYSSGAVSQYMLDVQGIVIWFEITQIFWFLLVFAHIWAKKGWNGVVLFWGVGLFYGILLENGGIFMEFFYEDHFKLYLPNMPAPICTMFGWVIVMYICSAIAEGIAARISSVNWTPIKLAFLTTAVALALDLQADPIASLSGIWWRWNELLPGFWFGVPMVNYVAWFSAVLPFAFGMHYLNRKDFPPMMRNKQLFYRLLPIVLVACVLNFGLMAIWELMSGDGFLNGPTYQILDQFFDKIWPYQNV